MKAKSNNIVMQNKNIIRIVLGAALILLVPLLAMLITDEVAWGPADFAVAGALLVGTGLTYELVVKKVKNTTKRAVLGIVLAAAFLLIWIELAVGIFGTPFSGQ